MKMQYPTVHFLIGTKAQLIKLAPVMNALSDMNIPYRMIDSGQHSEMTRSLRLSFSLKEPDVSLRTGRDISSIIHALIWSLSLSMTALFRREYLRKQVFPGGGICVVHGDTLSTLLGMLLAKSAGLKVAHLEAGLRSAHLFDPFPEELIRLLVMRHADLLLAPSELAFSNLLRMRLKGRCERICGNTVLDAIRKASFPPPGITLPKHFGYALVTCHRLETITNRARLTKVVDLINKIAKQMPVVFAIHQVTRGWLARYGQLERLDDNVLRTDNLDYPYFSYLLKNAHCVIADGGSIQEECAYLGKPCLIIRNRTERQDGVGENAILWQFNDEVADHFINSLESFERDPLHETCSPSSEAAKHIVAQLVRAE